MANKHGDWIWYELLTPDAAAAARFYSAVLGWSVGDQPDYREIETPAGHVGGMLQLSPEMIAGGAHPGWLGYVAVDDVDAMIGSVEQGGGRLLMPPRDLPEAGRFALVADRSGAPFYVMRPKPMAENPESVSTAFSYETPILGHCAWNELATDDPTGALRFYGTRFGWVKDGELDMGPIGTYHFIRHGETIGAIMPRMPMIPVSAWRFYFRVADIDAAAATVTAQGGQIVHGPVEVPGGDFVINGFDPQGAGFALVGKKRA